MFDDLTPRRRIRSGGERQARDIGEEIGETVEGAVFGPEIMAPVRKAVGLVDGDERETAGLQPNWYALTATSKAATYLPTTGGYLLPEEQYHSGVVLDHCDVFGSISVEAWKLSCLHTTLHGGVPAPE